MLKCDIFLETIRPVDRVARFGVEGEPGDLSRSLAGLQPKISERFAVSNQHINFVTADG